MSPSLYLFLSLSSLLCLSFSQERLLGEATASELQPQQLLNEEEEQRQQQQVLLLLRRPPRPNWGPLWRSCLLYGEALRLFAYDGAACIQLVSVFQRAFTAQQQLLQQHQQQQQQLMLPHGQSLSDQAAAAELKADVAAASYAAAAIYWSLRAAVGPFSLGGPDELTMLLQRMATAGRWEQQQQQQHQQQQVALPSVSQVQGGGWRFGGGVHQQRPQQQQLQQRLSWRLLVCDFAQLLQRVHLGVDLDELPATLAAFEERLSCLLQQGPPEAAASQAPMLLLLLLAAAAAYVKATGAAARLQNATEVVLAATRKLRQQEQQQQQQQQQQQTVGHNGASGQQWEQLTHDLYRLLDDGLLTTLQQLQQQQRQQLEQPHQQQLLLLQELQQGTPQMNAALELCCCLARAYCEAARALLQSCCHKAAAAPSSAAATTSAAAAAWSAAAAAADDPWASEDNGVPLQRSCSVTSSNSSRNSSSSSNSSSSTWGPWLGSEDSRPHVVAGVSALVTSIQSFLLLLPQLPRLELVDGKGLALLKQRLASLIPLLLNCKAFSVAAAAAADAHQEQQQRQQQQHSMEQQQFSAIGELQAAIELALPEDSLLVGFVRLPLLLPRKTLLLQLPEQHLQEDEEEGEQQQQLAASAIQEASSPSASGAACSPRGYAEADEELLLLRAPLQVRSTQGGPVREGSSFIGGRGPSNALRGRGPLFSPKEVPSSAEGDPTALVGGPSVAAGAPASVAWASSKAVFVSLGGVAAAAASEAAAAGDVWSRPSLAAARAARLLVLLDSEELEQVLQQQLEEQQQEDDQAAAALLLELQQTDVFLQYEKDVAELEHQHEVFAAAERQQQQRQQQQQQQASSCVEPTRGGGGRLWGGRGSGGPSRGGFGSGWRSSTSRRSRRGYPTSSGGWGSGACGYRGRLGREWGGGYSSQQGFGFDPEDGSPEQQERDNLIAIADSWGAPYGAPQGERERLVVIDASNVAIRYGDGGAPMSRGKINISSSSSLSEKRFVSQGLVTVVRFFKDRGFKVRAFGPSYLVEGTKPAGGKRHQQEATQQPVNHVTVPDCIPALKELQLDGTLVLTPPQDYDDMYCVHYALKNGGCIVTNDLYRDVCLRLQDKGQKVALRNWFRRHLISYAFVDGEFLPNPDFRWPLDDQQLEIPIPPLLKRPPPPEHAESASVDEDEAAEAEAAAAADA
ncbi:hypothetical protein Esti_004596 [Eimeria stiedai]